MEIRRGTWQWGVKGLGGYDGEDEKSEYFVEIIKDFVAYNFSFKGILLFLGQNKVLIEKKKIDYFIRYNITI